MAGSAELADIHIATINIVLSFMVPYTVYVVCSHFMVSRLSDSLIVKSAKYLTPICCGSFSILTEISSRCVVHTCLSRQPAALIQTLLLHQQSSTTFSRDNQLSARVSVVDQYGNDSSSLV